MRLALASLTVLWLVLLMVLPLLTSFILIYASNYLTPLSDQPIYIRLESEHEHNQAMPNQPIPWRNGLTRRAITHEWILGWLIPALLSAIVCILTWMGTTLHDMAGSLRVVVYRVDDHERRLQNLETLFLRPPNNP